MLPVLVYDGDCAFCSTSARFIVDHLRGATGSYAVEPWQRVDLDALGLTPQECDEAVRWVAPDGSRYAGHVAIARALLASRWWVRPLGAAVLAPGISTLAAAAYRWVSANRHRLPGGAPSCAA